mmetsp:Transcript_127520/g.397001  ORF Transcript_127520/g.397001 Transcript_127520/m.397001 type:complete len:200 (-) Transcript_127520:1147-1746(-)
MQACIPCMPPGPRHQPLDGGRRRQSEVLQQAVPVPRPSKVGRCLRDAGPCLLRHPAWHMEERLQHEGPVLVVRQRRHAATTALEEASGDPLALSLRAMRECRLQHVAGTPVARVALQVGDERLDDPPAMLRQMLQHALYDVVREWMLAEDLGLGQYLREEDRQLSVRGGVLNEPADDAASAPVTRHPCCDARQLLHHKV